MIHVTKENYEEEVMKSDLPVIVDFWAEWCGPCKMMGPVFEELSEEYEGRLRFAKCNTDEFSEFAAQNQVQGIPSLIIFKDGKEADRIVGFAPKEVMKSKIDEVLTGL